MKPYPITIIQTCLVLGMLVAAEGQTRVKTTVIEEDVPQIMSEFFSSIAIADEGLILKWKKQETMTSCMIDGQRLKNLDQPIDGETIHLGKNQRFSITQRNGLCRIHTFDGLGLNGIAVSRNARLSDNEKISKMAASKIDWANKKWTETSEIDQRRLLETAEFIKVRKPLVPKGSDFTRVDLNDLLQEVFKTVTLGENGVELRFKDEVNRHRFRIDDQDAQFSEAGEIIRIAPGQKWKLLDRHWSLTIVVTKDKNGLRLAAGKFTNIYGEGMNYSVATGRADAVSGKFAPLEKTESEDILKSTWILDGSHENGESSPK